MIHFGCFLYIYLTSLTRNQVLGNPEKIRYLHLDPPFKYYDYMCPHHPFSIGGHPWIFTKPTDCAFNQNHHKDLPLEVFGNGREHLHSAKNITVCCIPHVFGSNAPWVQSSPDQASSNQPIPSYKELFRRPADQPISKSMLPIQSTIQTKTLEDVEHDVEMMHFMFMFAGAACAQFLIMLFAVGFLFLMRNKIQIGIPADHEAVIVVVHVKTTEYGGDDQQQQIDSDLQSI